MKYFSIVVLSLMFAACGSDPSVTGTNTVTPGATNTVTVTQDPPLHDPQFVVPCKTNISKVPEALVYSGGVFYRASGNVGANITFVYLPPGSYSSNDNRGCNFTINLDNTLSD